MARVSGTNLANYRGATFMDYGSYKFEMHMVLPDGKEMKSMELVCKRK